MLICALLRYAWEIPWGEAEGRGLLEHFSEWLNFYRLRILGYFNLLLLGFCREIFTFRHFVVSSRSPRQFYIYKYYNISSIKAKGLKGRWKISQNSKMEIGCWLLVGLSSANRQTDNCLLLWRYFNLLPRVRAIVCELCKMQLCAFILIIFPALITVIIPTPLLFICQWLIIVPPNVISVTFIIISCIL